jgi:hypothetical protein
VLLKVKCFWQHPHFKDEGIGVESHLFAGKE